MWVIEGRSVRIWISSQGHLSFGGNASSHECRPVTDRWNETGQFHEATRISRLPLHWTATSEASGAFEDYLRTEAMVAGRSYRWPQRAMVAFRVYEDSVSLSFQLAEEHFASVYDALRIFLTSSAPNSSYLLTHGFLGTRHPTSDSEVPTADDFYRHEHPYVSEESPDISFVFGRT